MINFFNFWKMLLIGGNIKLIWVVVPFALLFLAWGGVEAVERKWRER